jgi:hypothetical protein
MKELVSIINNEWLEELELSSDVVVDGSYCSS